MLETDRRSFLAALLALPTLNIVEMPDEPWPHPHLGRDAIPKGWKPGAGGDLYSLLKEDVAVVGVYMAPGDRILSRGRIYTASEWPLVQRDVLAYVKRRNETVLDAKAAEFRPPASWSEFNERMQVRTIS
jgi:hypothetical protein